MQAGAEADALEERAAGHVRLPPLQAQPAAHARSCCSAACAQALGPKADIATHFTPRYNPWEQRLCLVPDGDFFQAINAGSASVVTDQIESFTETGVQLKSGAALDADIIVSATGLKLAMLGKAALYVDGERVEPARTVNYKGLMYSGVPNLANTFGYTNASWTLKADLTAQFVCRLLNHMRKTGARSCLPPRRRPRDAVAAVGRFLVGLFPARRRPVAQAGHEPSRGS